MAEIKSGIYCIENIINGKKYIGKGKNAEKRMWESHKKCSAINSALKKYGNNYFKRYIIEYCELEKLTERERYYIKEWNTKAPNGYNLTDGGEGVSGYVPSEATRKLKSMLQSGEKNPFYGKHHSSESKKLISLAISGKNNGNYGTHNSDTQKKNSSIRMSGKNNPMFGIPNSPEQKIKHSIRMSGKGNPRFGTKLKNASSQYFGVSKLIEFNKYIYWLAYTKVNGIHINIKKCKNEIEAAYAYDKYIIENDLPNSLNFPESDPRKNKSSS